MRGRRRTWGAAVAVVLAVTGAMTVPTAAQARSAAVEPEDDFNGDGYADLAVAAPSATVAGKAKAGYVAVLYGTPKGLATTGRKVFTQNSAGVPGAAEAGDRFGSALTTADLDRDGYTDLVVGVAGEDTGTGKDAGYLEVLWGGPKGLSGAAALAGGLRVGDGLGAAGRLTAADVDGDGATDLITVTNAHDLRVLKGPFKRTGAASGTQNVTDRYDSRILDLAVGDLNGDGRTDVVAAANSAEEFDSRRIQYWYGTDQGVSPYFTLVYDIDGAGMQGGENLAVGDVDRDGYADIVVGRAVDGYDSDHDSYRAKGGSVTFVPGTAEGPVGVEAVAFNQDAPGVPGTAEKGDRFGTDVQLGDVDGDGYLDVVTGAPGEDLGRIAEAGMVVALRGTGDGLTADGSLAISQNTASVPGVAEKGDLFGRAVHLGDFNGDGRSDLAVGAPGENANAGGVWAFPATSDGITAKGSFTFGAGTLGTSATNALLGTGFTY
ncbi:FG-GAP-like repeat-containing protein [Streptomyces sp. NPDC047072]|uniref:FG-GAP-like repeat-containing protein n=1 Tax=Streptomyces sp. NPDC047072 TaxID=3154809 RepID=UPI0033DB0F85